uniref:ATPase AAA-type core domain-containing protein n=1 Tax=Chelydra serpentina TaxID=8475 RepID=A0A8C3RUU2_CHESE
SIHEIQQHIEVLFEEISKDLLTWTLMQNGVLGLPLCQTVFGAAIYYSIKWVSDALDSTQKQRMNLKKWYGASGIMQVGVKVKLLTIFVTWTLITGLSLLMYHPLQGLLCGFPGSGKTHFAKFIHLQASSLADKWYRESQKLTAAVFLLDAKIQPCIILIAKIGSFLQNCSSTDHEANAMIKAQFMSLWDGLESRSDCQVMVLGVSNRPHDVDPAILRRMPATFQISLPTPRQQQDILKLILARENMSLCTLLLLHCAQEAILCSLQRSPVAWQGAWPPER